MRIQALTLDYPPRRFIGSEMMTHRLLDALSDAGHFVRVGTGTLKHNPGFEGIDVTPHGWLDSGWADAYLVHADYAGQVLDRGRPVVAICHNLEPAVLVSLRRNQFSLVVANSDCMRQMLVDDGIESIVVHPPAPKPSMVSEGELVTVVNLNENKIGRFWDIARAMPEQGFLAVLGGYGDQLVPDDVPPNVDLVEHVRAHRMPEEVWSRTRLLLAPSSRESWNMTAGEAIAFGIPVLSTDLPGVRENLGPSATYLDAHDVGSWVDEIRVAAEPNSTIQQQATLNRRRYERDLHEFVKAVDALGVDHRQTA